MAKDCSYWKKLNLSILHGQRIKLFFLKISHLEEKRESGRIIPKVLYSTGNLNCSVCHFVFNFFYLAWNIDSCNSMKFCLTLFRELQEVSIFM